MVTAHLPGNRAECVALIISVNGDFDNLTAEQNAAVRKHFFLDDDRTVSERTSQAVSNGEISAFIEEVNQRKNTSTWLLTRERSLYRAGDDQQQEQILGALEPLAGNTWVLAFVMEPGARYDVR